MKKITILWLIFILSIFSINSQIKIQTVKAETLYVGNTQDYTSIQEAINNSTTGDIIYVYSGTYNETINITREGISLIGEDKENTIINAKFLGNTIKISKSNVTIKNFTIKNANQNGIQVENIENIKIDNCSIQNNSNNGILLYSSNNNEIKNSDIYNNKNGLYIDNSSNNIITKNNFYDNTEKSVKIVLVKKNDEENNIFYHNNFLSNTANVFDKEENIWYNTNLSNGNYWACYDDPSEGAYDNNTDGIIDTHFPIPGNNNFDYYPLALPGGLQKPVAISNGPYNGVTDVDIYFDASNSYDPDGTYVSYEWNLGNGIIKTDKNFYYNYSTTGNYTITLTVTDYHGLTDNNTTIATITAIPNTLINITNPSIINGSTNVLLSTSTLSVTINESQGNPFNWIIETSPDIGSSFGNNESNGTISCNISGLNYSTTYYWYVNVSDGYNLVKTWFTFTIENMSDENQAPIITNPNPVNGSTGQSLSLVWSISISDPDGDSFNWSIQCSNGQFNSAVGAFNGTKQLSISDLTYNTQYTVWVNVSNGYNWSKAWFIFTTFYSPFNNPVVFSNINPSNKSTGVYKSISSLSITISDFDGDTFNWTIETSPNIGNSFGNNESNGSKSCIISGLNYSTIYYWFVNATDGNLSTNEFYYFKTAAQQRSRTYEGGSTELSNQNNPPVANSGGPYYDIEDIEILFDGSDSYDTDGNITSWLWTFGDNSTSKLQNPNHTYSKEGNYTVTLKVTDNLEATNTTTTFALISAKPNILPGAPIVKGNTSGVVNKSINFSVNSNDIDGDLIQYVFNWSDSTNNTISSFMDSSTEFYTNHTWMIGGIYIVKVYAIDENNATSETQPYKVEINAYKCGSIGYLIDKNGDNIYDVFYGETTGIETAVEKNNGDYYIDINNDSKWDYTYNFSTNRLILYGSTKTDNPINLSLEKNWLIFIVLILVFSIIIIMVVIYNTKIRKSTKKKKIKKKKTKKKKTSKRAKRKKGTTKKKSTKKKSKIRRKN